MVDQRLNTGMVGRGRYIGFQRDDFTGDVVLDRSDGKFRLKGRSNYQRGFLFSETAFS